MFSYFRTDCVLTDLQRCLPLIDHNITQNKQILSGEASAKEVRWGVDHDLIGLQYPDYVLMADCIYYEAVSYHCYGNYMNYNKFSMSNHDTYGMGYRIEKLVNPNQTV